MARRYAQGTDVPVETSRAEIRALAVNLGADGFREDWDGQTRISSILFRVRGIAVRFDLRDPSPDDAAFAKDRYGKPQKDTVRVKLAAAESRRRWRELVLLIRAKAVAIQSCIVSFDQEFLPYMLVATADGETRTVHRAFAERLKAPDAAGRLAIEAGGERG